MIDYGLNEIHITPASNMRECRELAFDFWGRDCLYLKRGYALGLDRYTNKVDAAHVFGRGSHPILKLVPLNIILLNHQVHLLIDGYKNPQTGENVDRQYHENLLRLLIGSNMYDYLLEIEQQLRK